MLDGEMIKKEFLKHQAPFEYFHDLDEDFVYDEKYKAIVLYDGKWHNTKWFTNTIKELKRVFGTKITQAMFSIMESHKLLAPHKNEEKDTNLRYHIGIIVHPKENAYLQVERKKHVWKENEFFVFDTNKTHKACKYTNYKRVVLIVDYESK